MLFLSTTKLSSSQNIKQSTMRIEVKNVTEMTKSQKKLMTVYRHKPKNKASQINLSWLTSTQNQNNILKILLEQIKLYCDNSSLVGYKYITEIHRTWVERILWIILHLITIILLSIIVWIVLQDYNLKPLITAVDSENYPSNNLEFPAVSVCSINRISRKAVVRFAERIKAANITSSSMKKILDLLYELGNLYGTTMDVPYKNVIELDEMLTKFFHGDYNLTHLMRELSPQCSDIFLMCGFRYERRNCSSLFKLHKTQDGYCCIFNYARLRDDTRGFMLPSDVVETYKIAKFSELNGLIFLMDSFKDDYFFPFIPTKGWKVTIFNPSDYPDNTSGGVSDALISPGTETFLEVNAVSFFSEKAVRRFDVAKRKCIFNDEVSSLYSDYSYSNCIVNCKVDDIWNTCGCRPFFYPKNDEHRVCTPSDVRCLKIYKLKWWSILPHDVESNGEESQMFDYLTNKTWSLRCKHCYPSCSDVRYYVQASSLPITEPRPESEIYGMDISRISFVNIFISKYGTVRLKQDVAYYWYELLSNIGGICGIFIGFSLISAIELIYFCVLSGSRLWRRTQDSKEADVGQDPEVTGNVVRSIYWAELAPRAKLNIALTEMHYKKRLHAY